MKLYPAIDEQMVRLIAAIMLAIGVMLLASGCETAGSGSQYRADDPALLDQIIAQADFLESAFGIRITATVNGVTANDHYDVTGISWYSEYHGYWIEGYYHRASQRLCVARPYAYWVVRHELLHAAGYDHHEKGINGVRVSDHVRYWRDL